MHLLIRYTFLLRAETRCYSRDEYADAGPPQILSVLQELPDAWCMQFLPECNRLLYFLISH
jgi:hypothetical protein